jgi:hypothetical protein
VFAGVITSKFATKYLHQFLGSKFHRMAYLDTLSSVRASCHAFVEKNATEQVRLASDEVIVTYAKEVAREFLADNKQFQTNVVLPLSFATVAEEVNTLILLQLLNFGSGFRHELHASSGSGAWESILRFVLSHHILGKKVDAAHLQAIDVEAVAQLMNVSLGQDVEVMPAIYEMKPSPLKPFVVSVATVLNTSGNALHRAGWNDFFAGYKAALAAARADADSSATLPNAKFFVHWLVSTFPAFDDKYTTSDGAVYLYKKAQKCAAQMHQTFRTKLPEFFNFTDYDELTVMADNVLPSVLVLDGVLKVSTELARDIDARVPIAAGTTDVALRAATVHVCSKIVQHINNLRDAGEVDTAVVVAEADLDAYLWKRGKDTKHRAFERHITTDTIFY